MCCLSSRLLGRLARSHHHQVIPGVSSAFAAPLLSSIAVTHRSVSNQVREAVGRSSLALLPHDSTLPAERNAKEIMAMAMDQVYVCTGYGKDGSRPYLAPYFRNQTAVFLMAVGRLGELCENLRQVRDTGEG